MDVTAIGRNVEMLPAPARAIPAGKAAENREVVRAVKAVNGAEMFGRNSELTFQVDPITEGTSVQLVNPKTKDVISQIPAEYVLRLAEDLKPRES
ncbi:MAG TPA: flagellar protein FlaG [Candidatus Acidoferrales bacterium]|jgi:uncharacterized FlaG/YvyC family protein|nr:flagellar protein FlaG [Candidatus Acidoferrales bacterium]